MRQTRDQLIERNSQLESEHNLYLQAVQDLAHDDCQHIGTVRSKGESYTYKVSRPCGAMGGILYITYRCDGQTPSTHISWVEDSYRQLQERIRWGLSDSPDIAMIPKAQQWAWAEQHKADRPDQGNGLSEGAY